MAMQELDLSNYYLDPDFRVIDFKTGVEAELTQEQRWEIFYRLLEQLSIEEELLNAIYGQYRQQHEQGQVRISLSSQLAREAMKIIDSKDAIQIVSAEQVEAALDQKAERMQTMYPTDSSFFVGVKNGANFVVQSLQSRIPDLEVANIRMSYYRDGERLAKPELIEVMTQSEELGLLEKIRAANEKGEPLRLVFLEGVVETGNTIRYAAREMVKLIHELCKANGLDTPTIITTVEALVYKGIRQEEIDKKDVPISVWTEFVMPYELFYHGSGTDDTEESQRARLGLWARRSPFVDEPQAEIA